jgi:hypothetical protein
MRIKCPRPGGPAVMRVTELASADIGDVFRIRRPDGAMTDIIEDTAARRLTDACGRTMDNSHQRAAGQGGGFDGSDGGARRSRADSRRRQNRRPKLLKRRRPGLLR